MRQSLIDLELQLRVQSRFYTEVPFSSMWISHPSLNLATQQNYYFV